MCVIWIYPFPTENDLRYADTKLETDIIAIAVSLFIHVYDFVALLLIV